MLNDDIHPLDAMLEEVMLGVHQHLVVVERATSLVDQHLKDDLSLLATMVKDGFSNIN
jgi:hypothetical protein